MLLSPPGPLPFLLARRSILNKRTFLGRLLICQVTTPCPFLSAANARLKLVDTNINMEEVYVFGDQTADCRAFFAKVFTRKDNVLLQSFLERAGNAVRIENKYRTHPSKAVPNFLTIQELVDRYYRGDAKDAAIESALVCVSQFAHFIGYAFY